MPKPTPAKPTPRAPVGTVFMLPSGRTARVDSHNPIDRTGLNMSYQDKDAGDTGGVTLCSRFIQLHCSPIHTATAQAA